MQTIENIIEEAVARGVARALAEQHQPVVMEDSPTLTVKEAARLVGVHEVTMYNICHREDFDAAIRVGRSIKILRHKLLCWMERQTELGKEDAI